MRNWRAYYPKQKGAKNLTDVQLKKAINQLEEKHNAIMFLYKADRQKYDKLIEQMEHDMLQKNDPFPKRWMMCLES